MEYLIRDEYLLNQINFLLLIKTEKEETGADSVKEFGLEKEEEMGFNERKDKVSFEEV